MAHIKPFLWFDTQAEDAAKFYTEVFSGAPGAVRSPTLAGVARYPESTEAAAGKPKDSVMIAPFELAGMEFIALNGGPQHRFSEAISFLIDCEDQEEIDYFWGRLSAHPQSEQCGWLKDKFGLSWQVVPASFPSLVKRNPEKVMAALMQMQKLVIADLERAAGA